MKALALLLAFTSTTLAHAAPHSLADRLTSLIPEGYSEGVTAKGAPCRVVFSWLRGAGFEPEYARAQVIAEPDGNLVDVEIFFDGYRGKAYGRWSARYASLRYAGITLSAKQVGKRLIVKAEKIVGRRSIASSCQIQPQAGASLARE